MKTFEIQRSSKDTLRIPRFGWNVHKGQPLVSAAGFLSEAGKCVRQIHAIEAMRDWTDGSTGVCSLQEIWEKWNLSPEDDVIPTSVHS